MSDTLVGALDAVPSGRESGFTFVHDEDRESFVPMSEIVGASDGCGDVLRANGLGAGDRVGLLIVDPRDFLLAFFGVIRQGAVAVPLPPPLPGVPFDEYAAQLAGLLERSGARLVVAEPRLGGVVESLRAKLPQLEHVLLAPELAEQGLAAREGHPRKVKPSDLAFLQFTSGSTSVPKGVRVTHASLLANCRSILFEGLGATRGDVGVSWLPLYHDMGLIGFAIGTAVLGARAVLIPPLSFLRHPAVWLDAVTRHRGTISFAPNFALAVVARRASDADLARWDLSSLRVLGCGAEPIQCGVLRRFEERVGGPCGLQETALLPCYGLAEATLAVTFKSKGERWSSLRIDAKELARTGTVRGVALEHSDGVDVAGCGRPFAGHAVEIRSEAGARLGPRHQGEIWVRGPSLADGYWNDPGASLATWRDCWLRSGDLGWLEPNGELFVSGRIKDLIVVHGRNYHPQDIERVAETLPGVRPGRVAAFARSGRDTEHVVVALEVTETGAQLAATLRREVHRRLGLVVADVAELPLGTLAKTSSGKLRRLECRRRYESGAWHRLMTGE